MPLRHKKDDDDDLVTELFGKVKRFGIKGTLFERKPLVNCAPEILESLLESF